MFDQFTDRARRVMQLANQEAQRFNHEYIGTEHILIGLVKEGAGVGFMVLNRLRLDIGKIRRSVEEFTQPGPNRVVFGKLPQCPIATKALNFAIEEANNLHHNYVGTEHILLGLLRDQECVASMALRSLGVDIDIVRREILNVIGFITKSEPPICDPLKGWMCYFDWKAGMA